MTIICFHVWMNAVHWIFDQHQRPSILVSERTNVIKPNDKVMHVKKILGPRRRTMMVAGSWKHTLATVKIRIATEKRFPRSSSRSCSMDVTEALEIIPLSIRFRLASKPPIVQSLRSIFHFNLFSLSDALASSSMDPVLCSTSLLLSNVSGILSETGDDILLKKKNRKGTEGRVISKRHAMKAHNSGHIIYYIYRVEVSMTFF